MAANRVPYYARYLSDLKAATYSINSQYITLFPSSIQTTYGHKRLALAPQTTALAHWGCMAMAHGAGGQQELLATHTLY